MTNRAIAKELIIEKKTLDDKLERLLGFLYTKAFHSLTEHHQSLLVKQSEYMTGYSDTLHERIIDLEK